MQYNGIIYNDNNNKFTIKIGGKMRSERGASLTSIVMYIVALTVMVLTVGRIITYFYQNVNVMSSSSSVDGEIMKFNSFFTEEINVDGNKVYSCDGETITFYKTKNTYILKYGCIYQDEKKICKGLITDDLSNGSKFEYNENTGVITVTLVFDGHDNYEMSYTIAK